MKKQSKVLILVADNYEDLELHYPRLRLIEDGFDVTIAGEKKGHLYKSKHGYECKADTSFSEISVNSFKGVVIPGGYAPDTLRKNSDVLKVVQQFNEEKKIIAFICHAGWVPVSAKVIKRIKCTSYATIKDDIINAGGKWVDEACVRDKHFISSRFPDDLPEFCKTLLGALKE